MTPVTLEQKLAKIQNLTAAVAAKKWKQDPEEFEPSLELRVYVDGPLTYLTVTENEAAVEYTADASTLEKAVDKLLGWLQEDLA